jgi:hypothetical protein
MKVKMKLMKAAEETKIMSVLKYNNKIMWKAALLVMKNNVCGK